MSNNTEQNKTAEEILSAVFAPETKEIPYSNVLFDMVLEAMEEYASARTKELEEENKRLKKLLMVVLPMAEDGYTLSKRNGSHQEFLQEDRELLHEIKKVISTSTNEKKV
jgi:hypothetical protein